MAPTREPKVEVIITPKIFNFEYVVINPPNRSITSEGIGGKMFSTAIKKNTPK